MPVPVKEDVEASLQPYHARLRRVVERAWDEWLEYAAFRAESGMGPVLYSRTVANFVFDAIARIGMQEFASEDSVHIWQETQTVKFHFGGQVLVRFKKGSDDCLLGRNIPTQAVLDFLDPNGLLPGLPPETAKVEIVWRANEIHTRLEHINVLARDGSRLLWQYEIRPEGEGADIIPFPLAPAPMDDEVPVVRPKVRPAAKREGEET